VEAAVEATVNNAPLPSQCQEKRQSPTSTTTLTSTTTEEDLATFTKEKIRKGFRFQGKRIFLTYPQCQTSIQEVEDNLKAFETSWYIICQELHLDGNPHIHGAVEFINQQNFTGEKGLKCLDNLVKSKKHPLGKHGNYAAIISIPGAIRYCAKKGNYLVKNVDVNQVLETRKERNGTPLKKGPFSEVIDMMTEKDVSPRTIMKEFPLVYAMRRKHILDYHSDLQQLKRSKTSTKKLLKILPKGLMKESISGNVLVTWLNENVVEEARNKRAFKQKQLWLVGPKNMGKSTLIQNLASILRMYPISYTDYYCDYIDKDYDFAAMDEFCGQKSISFLNLWLEGSLMALNVKGKPCYMKRFNLPTIICSNLLPGEIYKKVPGVQLEALLTRLEIIEVTQYIELEYVTA